MKRKHIISDWLKNVSVRVKFSKFRHFVLFGDDCRAESETLSMSRHEAQITAVEMLNYHNSEYLS